MLKVVKKESPLLCTWNQSTRYWSRIVCMQKVGYCGALYKPANFFWNNSRRIWQYRLSSIMQIGIYLTPDSIRLKKFRFTHDINWCGELRPPVTSIRLAFNSVLVPVKIIRSVHISFQFVKKTLLCKFHRQLFFGVGMPIWVTKLIGSVAFTRINEKAWSLSSFIHLFRSYAIAVRFARLFILKAFDLLNLLSFVRLFIFPFTFCHLLLP